MQTVIGMSLNPLIFGAWVWEITGFDHVKVVVLIP